MLRRTEPVFAAGSPPVIGQSYTDNLYHIHNFAWIHTHFFICCSTTELWQWLLQHVHRGPSSKKWNFRTKFWGHGKIITGTNEKIPQSIQITSKTHYYLHKCPSQYFMKMCLQFSSWQITRNHMSTLQHPYMWMLNGSTNCRSQSEHYLTNHVFYVNTKLPSKTVISWH